MFPKTINGKDIHPFFDVINIMYNSKFLFRYIQRVAISCFEKINKHVYTFSFQRKF